MRECVGDLSNTEPCMDKLILGDCLEVLKTLSENSVDAVVTDPPYGLSFMGKKWDYDVPKQEIWAECLRVLKPGGYLLAFAGTRTQHRMAVRIEDAGFEIRDMIAWVYGSGFPKSLNIGKAVDKLQGNERVELGDNPNDRERRENELSDYGLQGGVGKGKITKGSSEWEGWGTALKPALEPITVARKPLSEKTVAENCLKWGTGGIDIDGSRVGSNVMYSGGSIPDIRANNYENSSGKARLETEEIAKHGRFPANFIHDGSDEVVGMFPNTKSGAKKANQDNYNHEGKEFVATLGASVNEYKASEGNASRFFYCAKASKSERNEGCEELPLGEAPASARSKPAEGRENALGNPRANNHPTVKPVALMKYLVKLVSRSGAVVLDPFAGSGSTLIACKKLNRKYIGIEREAEYVKIAEARLKSITPTLL